MYMYVHLMTKISGNKNSPTSLIRAINYRRPTKKNSNYPVIPIRGPRAMTKMKIIITMMMVNSTKDSDKIPPLISQTRVDTEDSND